MPEMTAMTLGRRARRGLQPMIQRPKPGAAAASNDAGKLGVMRRRRGNHDELRHARQSTLPHQDWWRDTCLALGYLSLPYQFFWLLRCFPWLPLTLPPRRRYSWRTTGLTGRTLGTRRASGGLAAFRWEYPAQTGRNTDGTVRIHTLNKVRERGTDTVRHTDRPPNSCSLQGCTTSVPPASPSKRWG